MRRRCGFVVECQFVTSPAEAMVNYCDEHVCVCVCVSVCLSVRPLARSLPIFMRMLPMAVAQSSSGRVTKSQGKGHFGGFLPH